MPLAKHNFSPSNRFSKERKTHCSFITFLRLENHLKFQPSLFSITSHPFFFLLPWNFPPHSGKSKSLLEISPRKNRYTHSARTTQISNTNWEVLQSATRVPVEIATHCFSQRKISRAQIQRQCFDSVQNVRATFDASCPESGVELFKIWSKV